MRIGFCRHEVPPPDLDGLGHEALIQAKSAKFVGRVRLRPGDIRNIAGWQHRSSYIRYGIPPCRQVGIDIICNPLRWVFYAMPFSGMHIRVFERIRLDSVGLATPEYSEHASLMQDCVGLMRHVRLVVGVGNAE